MKKNPRQTGGMNRNTELWDWFPDYWTKVNQIKKIQQSKWISLPIEVNQRIIVKMKYIKYQNSKTYVRSTYNII